MNTVERVKRILNKEDHLLQEAAPFTKFKNKENAERLKEFEQLVTAYGSACKYYGSSMVHSQGYPCKSEQKEVQDQKKKLLDFFSKTLEG